MPLNRQTINNINNFIAMRKTPFAICALSLLLIACNESPVMPEDTSLQEGVYCPERRIDYIRTDDNLEIWLWDANHLIALADDDMCGGYEEKCWFEYNGDRLISMQSTLRGFPYEAAYSYSDGMLSTVSAFSSGTEVLDLTFSHDTDRQLSAVHIDIAPELLDVLSSLLGGWGDESLTTIATFDSVSASLAFSWSGNNISQQVLTADLEGAVSMGMIKEIVDLESQLGSYAFLAELIPDSTMLPIGISLKDTTQFTFDNHTNPFYGLLYTPEAYVLCKNNIVSATHRGAATLTIVLQSPMGNFPIPLPYSLPERTDTYEYTYDEYGYPIEVYQNGTSFKTYSYSNQL